MDAATLTLEPCSSSSESLFSRHSPTATGPQGESQVPTSLGRCLLWTPVTSRSKPEDALLTLLTGLVGECCRCWVVAFTGSRIDLPNQYDLPSTRLPVETILPRRGTLYESLSLTLPYTRKVAPKELHLLHLHADLRAEEGKAENCHYSLKHHVPTTITACIVQRLASVTSVLLDHQRCALL